MTRQTKSSWLALGVLLHAACAFAVGTPVKLVPPLGLPALSIPAANPLTREKIDLGRRLFMDRRLSHNNTMSCAMCHVPEQGFTSYELVPPSAWKAAACAGIPQPYSTSAITNRSFTKDVNRIWKIRSGVRY